jgi:hypothetical protein
VKGLATASKYKYYQNLPNRSNVHPKQDDKYYSGQSLQEIHSSDHQLATVPIHQHTSKRRQKYHWSKTSNRSKRQIPSALCLYGYPPDYDKLHNRRTQQRNLLTSKERQIISERGLISLQLHAPTHFVLKMPHSIIIAFDRNAHRIKH